MGDENRYEAKENQSEIKYELDKKYTELEKSIGSVITDESNISVVVLRDKIYNQEQLENTRGSNDVNALREGESWEEFKYRIKSTPSIINIDNEYPQLHNLVANASGLNVSNVEILGYEVPVFIDKEIIPRSYNEYILLGILFVLIALLAYALIRKAEPMEITEIEPELSVEEMLESSQIIPEELDSIEYNEESEIKKQIDKFVDENLKQ